MLLLPLLLYILLQWWRKSVRVKGISMIDKCLDNINSGYFDMEAYRSKYNNIIPWMYTYRSLNTFCRRNLDLIIGDNIFYYLQNDKIALSRFLNIYGFKRPLNILSCRSKPDTTTVLSILNRYFAGGNTLILKPSNLSYSEGVAFLKSAADLSEEMIDHCYKYNCSFTEGSCMRNYEEKRGLVIQEALKDTEHVINEWKIMYIWGVPIVILWKIGHIHRYKIMTADYKVIYQERHHGKNICIHPGIPAFAAEMLEEGERLCKITGAPFLRVDMLWNDETYIVNETELLPSNYMFFPYEKLMMDLLKIPFHVTQPRAHTYIYEAFAYAYYLFHYIEYRIRRLNVSGLYKNLKH